MPSFVVDRSRSQAYMREANSVMRARNESSGSPILKVAKAFEQAFSECKNLPQYRYVTRPVYKFFVTKTNPVVATALSYLSADLLIHQLLAAFGIYLIGQMVGACEPFHFEWQPLATVFWLSFAVPVMYAKYHRDVTPPDRNTPAPVAKRQSVNRSANIKTGSFPLVKA